MEVPRDGRPAKYRCGNNDAPFSAAFLVPRRKVWLIPTARVQCSNAANTGERKTWTQSEFCTWQNSVKGQQPPKCICSVPAQETAKHLGWPSLSDVGAVTKQRRETCWNFLGCSKLANRSQPLVSRSSPYCEDMWSRYCHLTNFFDCRYVPSLRRYSPTNLCDGAQIAIFLRNFCVLYFQRAACSTFQTCILNSH